MRARTLFIIGFMYSGKTTVARQLAQYLADHHGVEVDVIDTDEALENRYHLTVADCFRRYGEPMFRTLETTVLKELTSDSNQAFRQLSHKSESNAELAQALPSRRDNDSDRRHSRTHALTQSSNQALTILSTGGGTPCFNDNMQWMLDHGITLYLKLDEAVILKRMAASRNLRPSIATLNQAERARFVHENLQKRESYYERAQLVFDGTDPDIAVMAQAVMDHLINKKL